MMGYPKKNILNLLLKIICSKNLKIIFISFFCFITSSYSQNATDLTTKVDSLKKIISTDTHDSIRIKAMREWDNLIYMSDPELDLKLNQNIDSICKVNLSKSPNKKEKRFFLRCRADANNVFGIYAQQTGQLTDAIKHYNVYLQISRELKDNSGIASAWSNLGVIYQMQGNFLLSTEYFIMSLKLREKMGDQKGMATSNNNIAMAFKDKNEYSTALKYYLKSLKIISKLKDEYSHSLVLNNVGTILQDIGDSASFKGDDKLANKKYKEALFYYEKSLKISKEIDDVYGEATALHNMGSLYTDLKNEKKAIEYYQKALKIREELGEPVGMSSSLNNLALIYQANGNHTKALELANRALKLAEESSAMAELSYAAKVIYVSFKKTGKYKDALGYYETHIKLRDSLANEENQKAVMQLQFKYKYEKRATADSTKNAEEQKVKDAEIQKQKAVSVQQELEIRNKKNQQIYLFIGITFLLFFLGFVYNRFRVTNRQKKIIETQKAEVEKQKSVVVEAHHQLEEKNKEILDSINYAKRIQQAILPSRYSVSENIKNGFIIYKPKDIVAGDFYWIEKYNHQLFIAAADCTGHGVPGAMVSVVCSNALSKALLEDGITETGKILDRTRELVIEKFSKSEENVQDGMDISLLSMNLHSKNERGITINWSGANNPLWIIRNGELIEYKPNKQPIGKYSDPKPFTTIEIELTKEDTIYIFTDGLQDQFGGEKGKKFKAAKFKELLLSVQGREMLEQKTIIENTFEEWRGNIEQNDDVCVIGIKI